jgi:O-antigen/teichoic acid export membrane protein
MAVPLLAFAAYNHGLFRIVGLGAGLAGRSKPWAVAGLVELGMVGVLFVLLTPRGGATAAGLVRYVSSLVGVIVCARAARSVWPQRLPVARSLALGAAGTLLGCLSLTLQPSFGLRLALGALVVVVAGVQLLRLYSERRKLAP